MQLKCFAPLACKKHSDMDSVADGQQFDIFEDGRFKGVEILIDIYSIAGASVLLRFPGKGLSLHP